MVVGTMKGRQAVIDLRPTLRAEGIVPANEVAACAILSSEMGGGRSVQEMSLVQPNLMSMIRIPVDVTMPLTAFVAEGGWLLNVSECAKPVGRFVRRPVRGSVNAKATRQNSMRRSKH
jgi:hypothetical protein